jgi:prefoldin subunit 5
MTDNKDNWKSDCLADINLVLRLRVEIKLLKRQLEVLNDQLAQVECDLDHTERTITELTNFKTYLAHLTEGDTP